MRTRNAVEGRRLVVERFGMSPHASFMEAAAKVIEADNLFADIPQTREQACAFLATYWLRSTFYGGIKSLPHGFTRSDLKCA